MTNDNIELASKALDDFAKDLEVEVSAQMSWRNLKSKFLEVQDVVLKYQREEQKLVYEIVVVFQDYTVNLLRNQLDVSDIATSVILNAYNYELDLNTYDAHDEFDDFKIKREEELKWLNARFAAKSSYCLGGI